MPSHRKTKHLFVTGVGRWVVLWEGWQVLTQALRPTSAPSTPLPVRFPCPSCLFPGKSHRKAAGCWQRCGYKTNTSKWTMYIFIYIYIHIFIYFIIKNLQFFDLKGLLILYCLAFLANLSFDLRLNCQRYQTARIFLRKSHPKSCEIAFVGCIQSHHQI